MAVRASGTTNVLISNHAFTKNANPPSPSHYAKNQRMSRNKGQLSGPTSEAIDKRIAQVESNVFTKLALGNCMENLMKTTRQSLPKQLFAASKQQNDGSSGHSCSMCASIPHKSVQNLKKAETIGIPIPPRRSNNTIDDHIKRYPSFMNSPPSGRYSPNNFMYGSPTMSSSPQSGYLEVYGSSGSGKVSRAASPQPLSNVGGATGCGEYSIWGENVAHHEYHDERALPTGYSHIGIFATDVYEFCNRLMEFNVTFIKKPDEGVALGNAFILDPDGYWVEIMNPYKMSLTE